MHWAAGQQAHQSILQLGHVSWIYLLAQVIPSLISPYSAESWPKTPFISCSELVVLYVQCLLWKLFSGKILWQQKKLLSFTLSDQIPQGSTWCICQRTAVLQAWVSQYKASVTHPQKFLLSALKLYQHGRNVYLEICIYWCANNKTTKKWMCDIGFMCSRTSQIVWATKVLVFVIDVYLIRWETQGFNYIWKWLIVKPFCLSTDDFFCFDWWCNLYGKAMYCQRHGLGNGSMLLGVQHVSYVYGNINMPGEINTVIMNCCSSL